MLIYELPKLNIQFKNRVKSLFQRIRQRKSFRLSASPRVRRVKNWFGPVLIMSVFAASFLGFLVGAVTVNYFISRNQDLSSFDSSSDTHEPTVLSEEKAVIDTVKRVSPAVVSVIITKDVPVMEEYYSNPFEGFQDFFGNGINIQIPQYRQNGTEKKEVGGGTGFIISEDGLILTNKHVVIDKEAQYTVLTNDGSKYDATVLARDPVQDIAVLKIEAGKRLPVAILGDSDKLEIGQSVIAIGNVLGEYRNSVTVGIIAGLRRSITASSGSFSETLENIIQTDAAINAGNSGGPLLNLKGEVIGMNTAMAQDAENVGFAIPINEAKRDISQVKETGKITYPFLGVYYTLITPALQKEFSLAVDYGAWIGRDQSGKKTATAVFNDSAAEKAGIKQDDIILEFGGEKITLDNTLARLINDHNPKDSVLAKVLSGQEEKTVTIVLGERSE